MIKRVALLLTVLTLQAPLLRAQPTATLTVRVAGAAMPASGYLVELRQARLAITGVVDSSRIVVFKDLPPGEVDLEMRAVGYKPVRAHLTLSPGSNGVEFTAMPQRIELATVRVRGDRDVPERLQGFERRRALGEPNGVVDQAEIERVNPVALTVMLGRLPGVRVYDSLGIKKLISRRGGRMVGGAMIPCQLRVMIDGVLVPLDFNLDAIPPRQVYAVEIYLGAARMPPEFGSLRENSQCGLALIWTRSG